MTFKASPSEPGDVSTVTILVGPNNSGKSVALREIEAWAAGEDRDRAVIDELNVDWPESSEAAAKLLKPFETSPNEGEVGPPDSILISTFRPDGSQPQNWVERQALHPGADSTYRRRNLLYHFTARLDGRTRFTLMDDRPWQDQQAPPTHHLAALFKDNDLRQRVRDLVVRAFPGRYFVIDPTGMGQFRVKMSPRPPADVAEERGWDDRAISFHSAAEDRESLSDGVVCFTGLVAATVALPHRVLLVDEPEAFLHPPLARLLGSSLSSLSKERGATLVAATHSAEFLMGCIDSGVEATIIRLTYEAGMGGARTLSPADLKSLITDPLLRSTRALTGLFHQGVVVGESDHDRAFYDEINRRLTEKERGATDTFFTNAQNWHTIARVIKPLRQLGVPAAAVLDLDTLTGPKREWEKLYRAMSLDVATEARLEAERETVKGFLSALSKPDLKRKGLLALGRTRRATTRSFLTELAEYGVFVVPVGELESWLSNLGVASRAKRKWIVGVFRALGSNPASATWVAPGRGDVWAFLDGIGSWIANPTRKGLPS